MSGKRARDARVGRRTVCGAAEAGVFSGNTAEIIEYDLPDRVDSFFDAAVLQQ
jgi:hypothetical protein